MTTLEADFEAKLRGALLADAERLLREEYGPLLKQAAEARFRTYASGNGYDIEHVWEDASEPTIETRGDTVAVRIEWPALTALFEFGVSPHTISGDPLLHFYWEEKDTWVKTEEVDWGSETGGIPEARAIRGALSEIRRALPRP